MNLRRIAGLFNEKSWEYGPVSRIFSRFMSKSDKLIGDTTYDTRGYFLFFKETMSSLLSEKILLSLSIIGLDMAVQSYNKLQGGFQAFSLVWFI